MSRVVCVHECGVCGVQTRGAKMNWICWSLVIAASILSVRTMDAAEPKKRVLLLWHSPDGHPKDTHEYQLGQKILKSML